MPKSRDVEAGAQQLSIPLQCTFPAQQELSQCVGRFCPAEKPRQERASVEECQEFMAME